MTPAALAVPCRLVFGAGLALALLAAPRGDAAESYAVLAVGDPPAGIDPDLAELTHQLRAACRDRVGNVLDVPTMQARLLGQSAGATLSELDRAYGGALAVYQNGEFDSALRTLRAVVEDLEALPEGPEAYSQWVRARLRLAHAAATLGYDEEADEALGRLLRVEPQYRADPDQFSPTYRRRLEEVRSRLRTLPQRRVTVLSAGRAGSIFVDGRPSGTTPMTVFLPAGRYRIGGTAGTLRVPSFHVDLADEDRTVVLDFDTAEALRMASGPGLAVPGSRRGEGLIRAGAWLDVDKLVVASRGFEGDAPFLVGSIYDVRRGAMLREGSVRTVAGAVPSVNIGALAAFLLTGAQQREVRGRSSEVPVAAGAASVPAPPPPLVQATSIAEPRPLPAQPQPADLHPAPRNVASGVALFGPPPAAGAVGEPPPGRAPARWMRPAAWIAGGFAVGFAGLAVERRIAANDAYDRAESLLGPSNALTTSTDLPRYRSLTADGDAAVRNAWISAGASVVLGAVAGLLGWSSVEAPPAHAAF
jgi:hypothetical protein